MSSRCVTIQTVKRKLPGKSKYVIKKKKTTKNQKNMLLVQTYKKDAGENAAVVNILK